MTDDFTHALEFLFENEGEFSNDPDDLGGKTNFGITERELQKRGPNLGINCSIEELTKEQAAQLYYKFWWEKYNYESIASRAVSTKSLDLSVNIGAVTYNKLLQRAVNDMGYNLLIDGVIGPKTLAAINEVNDMVLLTQIKERAVNHYKKLVLLNPRLKKFIRGWLLRANR